MKLHTRVLLGLALGVGGGLLVQRLTPAPAWLGAGFEAAPGAGVRVAAVRAGGPLARTSLGAGDVATAIVLHKGSTDPDRPERRIELSTPEDVASALAASENGELVRIVDAAGEEHMTTLAMDPASPRARWIAPFDFLADVFVSLLKMLIVPLVMSSIVSGVAGVGSLKDLRRLGVKTIAYYVSTSLLAILVGQVLVSVFRPGHGAELGLARLLPGEAPSESFVDIVKRMVPENVFASMTDNAAMLQIIFFALLFGYFATQTAEPHRGRVVGVVEGVFQVMLRMAEGVLTLLPIGVFCLMARVVAKTGFDVFRPLLLFMGVVTAGLLIHALITLPLVLRFVARISPRRWFRAMAPALATAFSTSSSSLTLPVTLETAEKRGRVSNRITSFTLPLGATINMDGTALYECVGVVFLAQYYAGVSPAFDLTFADQVMVVVMALLASIGAAGIPSAGLVVMLAILSALGLPVEGAALLLAIDRPLDMLRTVVNVWSDLCGAATIARSEGEEGPLLAGDPAGG